MLVNRLLPVVLIVLIVLSACKNKLPEKKYPSEKLAPNDPFKETMVESRFYEINANEDNVVEGEEGTVLVIPEGSLVHKDGSKPKGKVKVELAEALDMADMVLSNLTTTSDGKQLQSGGMIYLNATAGGEELRINPDKPVRIEIPTDKKVPGMMVYRGIRDSAGNMNWVDPLPLINYLVPVDLSLLDFLPEGFYDTVANNMPYRGHVTADRKLADSLYYSLAINDGSHLTEGVQGTDMNEAHSNPNKKIIDGKYTDESYDIKLNGGGLNLINQERQPSSSQDSGNLDSASPCGINPASVKVLKDKKFANTFISTREFETRMRYIHRACKQQVLEIYIKNIDKNLWEADKLVYELLKSQGNAAAEQFKTFYEEKLGNVENLDKGAKLLSEYYNRQLKKVEEELEKLKKEETASLEKENNKFKEVKKQYREVLWKREKYRMDKYRFEWTDMGWVNVDTGWTPKECPSNARLEVTLTDTATYDRVYIYTLITSIKSLYRLNTTNNKEFYAGNPVDKVLDMPCNEPTVLLAIGYKGKQAYYTLYSFTALRENILTITEYLQPVTTEELKRVIRAENGDYTSENSIEKDLIFQEKFYKEKLRQGNLKREQEFIVKLYNIAFKCCNKEVSLGQRLFEDNCTACHAACGFVLGPELAGITNVRSETWLLKFIKNSQEVISSGDRMAVASFEKYNQQVMPAFEFLSDEEIKAILTYLKDVGCE